MSVWGRFRDDRMIGGRLLTASLILTAAYAASASAQSPVAPALVRPAPIPATGAVVGELTATAPRTPDGKPYGCYSIDTTAGSRWTVTMSSTALDSALQIARGALCSAASLQYQNDNVSPVDKNAQVSFTAVGGRYLILARSNTADGTGPYQLSALSSGGQQGVASAAPASVDRQALMVQQVEVRRAQVAAQVAAEEAAKRAAEAALQAQADAAAAEKRRKARERSEAFNAFMGATVTVLGEVNTLMAAENARLASVAAEQTAQLAQQAAAQRQAQADAQLAEAQRAQAAQSERTATPGSGAATSQSTAGLYNDTPQGRFMDHDAAIRAAIAAQRGGGVPGAPAQPQLNALEQQRIAAANQQARISRIQADEAARVQQERLAMARTAAGNFDRGPASSSVGQQAAPGNSGAMASPMPSPPSGGMSTVGLRPLRQDGDPGEGRLSRPGVAIGRCQASSASVTYSMDSFMGGGKVAAALFWQGDASCQPPGNATIWLRVQDGTAYGYAHVDGVLPRAGAVGLDMARIRDWDEMFCSFNGNSPEQCMDAAAAKQLWSNGRVVGFEIGW